jgi:hypothetical protein
MPSGYYAFTLIAVGTMSGMNFEQLNDSDYAQVIGVSVITNWLSNKSWSLNGSLDISTNGVIGNNFYYVMVCMVDANDDFLCSNVFQLNTNPVVEFPVPAPSYSNVVLNFNTIPSIPGEFTNEDLENVSFFLAVSNVGSDIPMGGQVNLLIAVASSSGLSYSQLMNGQTAQVISTSNVTSWPCGTVISDMTAPLDLSASGQIGSNYYYAIIYLQDDFGDILASNALQLNSSPVIIVPPICSLTVNVTLTPELPSIFTNGIPENINFALSASNTGSAMSNGNANLELFVSSFSGLPAEQLTNSALAEVVYSYDWNGTWNSQNNWVNSNLIDLSQFGSVGYNYYYAMAWMADSSGDMIASCVTQLNISPVVQEPPVYQFSIMDVGSFPSPIPNFTNDDGSDALFTFLLSNSGSSIESPMTYYTLVVDANAGGMSFVQLTNSQTANVIYSASGNNCSGGTLLVYNTGLTNISDLSYIGSNYYYIVSYIENGSGDILSSSICPINTNPVQVLGTTISITSVSNDLNPTQYCTYTSGATASFTILVSNTGQFVPNQGVETTYIVVSGSSGMNYSQLIDSIGVPENVICTSSTTNWNSQSVCVYNSGPVDISEIDCGGNLYFYVIATVSDANGTVCGSSVCRINTNAIIEDYY